MIVILISWLVIFYMISITGIVAKKSLNLSNDKTFILLYGIIFQTLFISIFAFFSKIGIAFFFSNLCLILLINIFIVAETKTYFNSLFATFKPNTKIFFTVFILITALKSAQTPTIFDNESYYIQSIKWLNQYGYVNGIANIHPFLAQCSFWHVFQSGFNFSFLTTTFNDVNGLLLIISIYYFIEKQSLKSNLFVIANSLFLVIYFQFIDAPSPDLPILIFLSIVFYEFIFNPLNTQKRKSLSLFILFLVFIKLTVAPLLLLLYYLVHKDKKLVLFCFKAGLVFAIIWLVKNSIITGYPLFPLRFIDFNFDWKLPFESMDYMYKNINNLGYAENAAISKNYSLLEKLNFWIHLKGINGFFNIGILSLFFVIPFTKVFKSIAKFKILYFILAIHFLFLLVNSPQYRFFLPTFILFGTVIIYEILRQVKFLNKKIIVIISLLILSLNLFIDVKNWSEKSFFNYSQFVFPESDSTYKNNTTEEKKIGNLTYYDPKLPNIYETSNGKLPCVNEKVFGFYTYFPQQRTPFIEDGFYAKKIKDE